MESHLDHRFVKEDILYVPHQPTQGKGWYQSTCQAVNGLTLQFWDYIGSKPTQESKGIPPDYQTFLLKASSGSSRFCMSDITTFIKAFEQEAKANVQVFVCGVSNYTNPTEAITIRVLNRSPKIIAYPYVFKTDKAQSSHMVLIVVDKEEKKIYYHDSIGLTSDDYTRKLTDPDWRYPNRSMKDELEALAKLMGNETEVIENIFPQQWDPYNCGTYVMRTLLRLFQGHHPRLALTSDSSESSDSIRRTIREAFSQKVSQRV